tara:strand:+ start:1925 stop:2143 length:219 start_codon:yes stop_codon:yes gene_type:complete
MEEKPIEVKSDSNSFELIFRLLDREFIGIKIASTNFSGKILIGAVLLLVIIFLLMEVFGLNGLLTSQVGQIL